MKGVRFAWKAMELPDRGFGKERQVGFIAQEVEQIIAEQKTAIADQTRAIAAQKEAIAEQKREIAELRAAEERTSARLERMEAMISRLAGEGARGRAITVDFPGARPAVETLTLKQR